MGVSGLEWFQKINIPNGMFEINMIDRIKDWKEKNPDGGPPAIIIQLKALIYAINRQNFDEMICAGRNHKLLKIIETFLEKLSNAGAKLVFFMRGLKNQPPSKHNDDRLLFKDKVSDEVYTKDFKLIDQNSAVEFDTHACRDYYAFLGLDAESIAEKYGELHFTYESYAHGIMNYIKTNENILAILAASSNFLILDYAMRGAEYWSCEHCYLKTKTCTTQMFDFEKLNNFFRFSKERKALFSAILMTHESYFETDMNLPFLSQENFEKCDFYNHNDPRYNRGKYCYKRIKITASYVFNEFPAEMLANGPDFDKVIRVVFNCEPDENLKAALQQQYDYYNELKLYKKKEEEANETEDFRRAAKNDPFVYNILYNNAIYLARPHFAFIDLEAANENIKSYAQLILSVHKRNMGILLQHRHDEEITCKIVTSQMLCTLFGVDNVKAEYPEIEVPHLNQLIFDEKETSDELKLMKWHLLFWTLSLQFDDFQRLQEIPDDLKPVVIALMFLRKEEQLTDKEADTILITEFDYTKGRIGDKHVYPKKLNGRIVRVAHLYVQIRRLINQCFRVCGLHQYAKSQNFDGVHFHNQLEKYENELLYNIALNKNAEIKKYRFYAN